MSRGENSDALNREAPNASDSNKNADSTLYERVVPYDNLARNDVQAALPRHSKEFS